MLTSGEWLKGELKWIREHKLEFDSSELDVIRFDWEDVLIVRSPRDNNCIYGDQQQVTGTLLIQDGKVTCGSKSFSREDLQAIVPGDRSEGSYWSGTASLGFAAVSGNTDSSNLTTHVEVTRDDAKSVLQTSYTGNFGKLEGDTNQSNHRIGSGYYKDVTSRLFLVVPAFEWFKDRFKNIDNRLILSAGLGMRIVDNPRTMWATSATAGWRRTSFVSVAEGMELTEDKGDLNLGSRLEHEIAKDTDLTLTYSFQMAFDDTADNLHDFSAIFTTELIGPFDFDVAFHWDRVNKPVEDADGITPEKDDYRTSVGVSMDF